MTWMMMLPAGISPAQQGQEKDWCGGIAFL